MARTSEAAERQTMRRIYWTAFIVRFALGCVTWFVLKNTYMLLIQDAAFYESMGAAVAQDWLAGRQSIWLTNAIDSGRQAWLMVAVVAGFYYILGGIRAVPLLIAAYSAITAITPVLTYKIARILHAPPEAAKLAAQLVIFSPAFVFWSGALYKEGLILLLLSLAVLQTLRLLHHWRLSSFLVLAISVPLLYGLRFYLAAILAVSVTVCLMMGRTKSKRIGAYTAQLVKQGAIAAAFVIGIISFGMLDRIERMIQEDPETVLERVEQSRTDLARARSGYLRESDVSTPLKAVMHIPRGSLYFLASPFPWQLSGSTVQKLTVPETALWVLMYPFVLLGALALGRKHWQGVILIVVLTTAMIIFYSLWVGNVGTAYRMRTQVWVFWAIFGAAGLLQFRQRFKKKHPRIYERVDSKHHGNDR